MRRKTVSVICMILFIIMLIIVVVIAVKTYGIHAIVDVPVIYPRVLF